MANNKFVYRHRRLDNNKVFYIGIGSKRRAFSKFGRSNLWNKIINKTNYSVEILKKNINWEEACELEILLISEYGRIDLKTGCLCNLTDGGEGVVNKEPWNKGLKGYRKGIKHSKETINKRSKSLKGRKLSKSHIESLNKKNGKKVINILSNKIYTSIRNAYLDSDFDKSFSYFREQVSGRIKNNTNFKLLNVEKL